MPPTPAPISPADQAIRAVLAGHPDRFSDVILHLQPSVMTLAFSILRTRTATEELAHDAFVRAYHRLHTYDPARPFKPWLLTLTYRLACDRHRQYRFPHSSRDLATLPTSAPQPLDSLLLTERDRLLWQSVQTLPPAECAAVLLYYREGLSVSEVAATTSVTPGTVKTLLFRARNHLRDRLTLSPQPERTSP